jgi:transcriptional accessory protein Tex/SPT6
LQAAAVSSALQRTDIVYSVLLMLIFPALLLAMHTHMHAALSRVGDAAAVDVFATNLKAALLAPPLKHKRVLGEYMHSMNSCLSGQLALCRCKHFWC